MTCWWCYWKRKTIIISWQSILINEIFQSGPTWTSEKLHDISCSGQESVSMYVSWRVYRSPCLNNAAASLNMFNYILITRKKKNCCKSQWCFLPLYKQRSVSHDFLTISAYQGNLASANISNQPWYPGRDMKINLWFVFNIQTPPWSQLDVAQTYNKSDIKWWNHDSFQPGESCEGLLLLPVVNKVGLLVSAVGVLGLKSNLIVL